MGNLTLSDKYGIAAAVALLIMVAINSPVVMLAVSLLGIVVGFWVVRQGQVRRVALVAFVAFVMAAVFAVISFARAG